jgi:hypothetical protein
VKNSIDFVKFSQDSGWHLKHAGAKGSLDSMPAIVKPNLTIGVLIGLIFLVGPCLPRGIATSLDNNVDVAPEHTEGDTRFAPQRPIDTPQTRAAEFTLKDQHNRTHRYHFPRNKASVLLMADHQGSSQLEDWVRPIYARFPRYVAIEGVAELSMVPRLMRGLVRAFFRGQLQYPVMLDWSGSIASLYHYQPGQANVFVIDQNGHIVLKILGAVSDHKLQTVLTSLERLINCQAP